MASPGSESAVSEAYLPWEAAALGGGSTRAPLASPALGGGSTRIPLAGGSDATLLSIAGSALLPLLGTATATACRLVCREFLAEVSRFPWEDRSTAILGSTRRWRQCFPRARVACCAESLNHPRRRRRPLRDEDCEALRGLLEVDISSCRALTDACFAHLEECVKLTMHDCAQPAIRGGAAFAPMRALRELDISACDQLGGGALASLGSLLRLNCSSTRLMDGAFAPLRSLVALKAQWCMGITDAAFAHLRGLRELDVSFCRQAALTDAAFLELRGLVVLRMEFCDQRTITDAAFAPLRALEDLDCSRCAQLTDSALAHVQGCKRLVISGCTGLSSQAVPLLLHIPKLVLNQVEPELWDAVRAVRPETPPPTPVYRPPRVPIEQQEGYIPGIGFG